MVDPVTDSLSLLVFRLAVAFGIGALVGLEREQSESAGLFAGSRTFPLFALYGALVQAFFPALLPVAVLAIAAPITIAYIGKVWLEGDIGLTTLTTALLIVVLGALTTHSERGAVVAVVVAGVVTALLSAKGPIHRFADRIDDRERRASVKFILVVFVVFPLLPDRGLDAAFGLNPRYVWLIRLLDRDGGFDGRTDARGGVALPDLCLLDDCRVDRHVPPGADRGGGRQQGPASRRCRSTRRDDSGRRDRRQCRVLALDDG